MIRLIGFVLDASDPGSWHLVPSGDPGLGLAFLRRPEDRSEPVRSKAGSEMDGIEIHPRSTGCTFQVVVVPRAGRNEISGVMGGALRLKTMAPPVDGAANEACVRYLSKLLQLPKSSVEIILGEHHKRKTIYVHGLGVDEVQRILTQATIR
jgi:uncharacterized protein (TIGR00251 family)